MTSINASSKLSKPSKPKTKAKGKNPSVAIGRNTGMGKIGAGGTRGTKKSTTSKVGSTVKSRGTAPPLVPKQFKDASSVSSLSLPLSTELREMVDDLLRQTFGVPKSLFGSAAGASAPRTASTSQDRGHAAADLATVAKQVGLIPILKGCGVLETLESQLIPNGIGAVFGNLEGLNPGGGMRKITSSVSIASMASQGSFSDIIDTGSTIVSDSKKGKSTPPEARQGSLLLLRALAQIVGKPAEPYIVPLLAACLEECSSSSSFVREAAEDTATAIISLANPHAMTLLICPVLFEALQSPEWRVKAAALEKLAQCASTAPTQISRQLPEIIPTVTPQVWDTKPQVTKAAAAALLACCHTNINPDVAPAIPAVVNAIVKPNETVKAVDELKGTTFVATVDASTLSILCPILSRGLKDKLAINKRSCCIVIENMSKLVETPDAVAPFGPLLVPELKKVAENVQFEEIRDAALAALKSLTKALGHSSVDEAISSIMKEEAERIEAEQKRIEDERLAELKREESQKAKEEEERRLWKEAMEAQRLLDKIALEEEEEKKAEDARKKEMAKKSTKTAGKCQGCGLKKCKKTCLFYTK